MTSEVEVRGFTREGNKARFRLLRGVFMVLMGFALALPGLGSQAWAQEAEGRGAARESSKDDAHYKELVDQALEEFRLKNWPEARVLFRKAHELNPNARTLRGMGVVSFEMRDYVQAVQQLSAALVDTRQPLTEAQRHECESLLGRARTFVGSYALHLEPVGAQASLDGAPLVRDQDGFVLVPLGDHVLRGTAAGYEDASTALQVQGGERADLALRLSPVAQAVAVAAPNLAHAAPTSGTPQARSVAPSSERTFMHGGLRYTWVALGVAALSGGGAAGLWYMGQSKLDDLDARCARHAQAGHPCEKGSTNTDTIQRYQLATNTMLGVAAAGAVATGLLMALEWPRQRNLSIDVGLQTLVVHGKF